MDPFGLCSKSTGWSAILPGVGKAFAETYNALMYNQTLHEGFAKGALITGKVVLGTAVFTAAEAYAVFDIVSGGPVTTSLMVAAGTPQGQQIISEFIPSMNPGTAPSPTNLSIWILGLGYRDNDRDVIKRSIKS